MGPNIILDTLLDTFLKTHDYTLFLPILKEVCGDLAEDVQLEDLRTYREGSKSGKPSSLGPGFTSVPGGDEYLNR